MNSISLDGFDTGTALAFESALLDQPEVETWCFWEGPEAVVVGKNQNLWREVDAAAVHRANLPLFRRISGGGAVFHGPGNLNFCHVFASNQPLDFDRLLQPVIQALGSLGIAVERRNCSDLWIVGGAKVSGNAVARRRAWWLHHGTLLVNADLERCTAWLGNSLGSDLQTRAVASRPSPVENLASRHRTLNVHDLARSLSRELTGTAPAPAEIPFPGTAPASRRWLIGNTLPYTFKGASPDAPDIRVRTGRLELPSDSALAPYSNLWHDPDDLLAAAARNGDTPASIQSVFFPSSKGSLGIPASR